MIRVCILGICTFLYAFWVIWFFSDKDVKRYLTEKELSEDLTLLDRYFCFICFLGTIDLFVILYDYMVVLGLIESLETFIKGLLI